MGRRQKREGGGSDERVMTLELSVTGVNSLHVMGWTRVMQKRWKGSKEGRMA